MRFSHVIIGGFLGVASLYAADAISLRNGTAFIAEIADTSGASVTVVKNGAIDHIAKAEILEIVYKGTTIRYGKAPSTSIGSESIGEARSSASEEGYNRSIESSAQAEGPSRDYDNRDDRGEGYGRPFHYDGQSYSRMEMERVVSDYKESAQSGKSKFIVGLVMLGVGPIMYWGGLSSAQSSSGSDIGTPLIIMIAGIPVTIVGIVMTAVGGVQSGVNGSKYEKSNKVLQMGYYIAPNGGGICGTF